MFICKNERLIIIPFISKYSYKNIQSLPKENQTYYFEHIYIYIYNALVKHFCAKNADAVEQKGSKGHINSLDILKAKPRGLAGLPACPHRLLLTKFVLDNCP